MRKNGIERGYVQFYTPKEEMEECLDFMDEMARNFEGYSSFDVTFRCSTVGMLKVPLFLDQICLLKGVTIDHVKDKIDRWKT